MSQTQTPTTDPNDPYAVLRTRAQQQVAGQVGSLVSAPITSTPSTPSPSFSPGVSAVPGAPSPDNLGPTQATNVAGQGPIEGSPLPGATAAPVRPWVPPTDYLANGDYQGWFKNLIGLLGNPASSYDEITKLTPQLQAAGIKVNTNLEGQPSKLILPNGHYISVVDANGAWRWQDQGTPADNQATQTAAPAAPVNPFLDQLKQMLMGRIQADSAPVDPNDPNIAVPYQAASDAAQRSTDQERTALAERLYAQGATGGGTGLNSNALTQGIQQSAEKNAGNLATLRGQLVMQAYTQKVQDLQQAYQLAVSAGDADSARQVQLELSALQAQVQREGLGVSLAENAANQNANTVNIGAGG